MKTLKVIGIILAFVALGIVGKIVLFGGDIIGNTLDTPREINNTIMNGDNAIKNYEWFKQQEADIERLYLQEETHKSALARFKDGLPEDKASWTIYDRDDYSKLSANITAQTDMLNKAIKDYNAKSGMVTKNIFTGFFCVF